MYRCSHHTTKNKVRIGLKEQQPKKWSDSGRPTMTNLNFLSRNGSQAIQPDGHVRPALHRVRCGCGSSLTGVEETAHKNKQRSKSMLSLLCCCLPNRTKHYTSDHGAYQLALGKRALGPHDVRTKGYLARVADRNLPPPCWSKFAPTEHQYLCE